MSKVLGVIPARYASKRFPGKPLAMIGKKPMIQWVWEAARHCEDLDHLIVATDDSRIEEAVEKFGGKVIMTSADHPSGTDRLAEVARHYPNYDILVNIQGDEPGIDWHLISGVTRLKLTHPEWDITTAARPLQQQEDLLLPERVKVVITKNGRALYFSRSLLPFPRYNCGQPFYLHLGIYAYKRDFLLRFGDLPPSPLEKTEALEQLRALENDFSIGVYITQSSSSSVDTPEDMERVLRNFKERGLVG